VIVLDDRGSLCEIMTDRDIVVRAVADDRSPSEVRLGDICSHDVTTVDASASVKDTVKMMRERATPPARSKGRPENVPLFVELG
jgi:signal-transduction protein with cAMP-binding, CBS, and nucleotidyltransferase domain